MGPENSHSKFSGDADAGGLGIKFWFGAHYYRRPRGLCPEGPTFLKAGGDETNSRKEPLHARAKPAG